MYLKPNILAMNPLQSVVAKINVFAVVVKEKEKGCGFIDLRGVHCCLQVLQLTNVSDSIYIQVLLLRFCARFYSFYSSV